MHLIYTQIVLNSECTDWALDLMRNLNEGSYLV